MREARLEGLYAISPEGWYKNPTAALELLEAAILGGVKIFQLREKQASDEAILPLARLLQRKCQESGVLFILNDRLELARFLGCDGVHLGKDDASITRARELLPQGIIGVSCYGDLQRAREAQALGADYVAFGACFSSPTKPEATCIGTEIFKRAKEELAIPCCAIGGINEGNASQLSKADMIAVISALWHGEAWQVEANARRIVEAWRG